MDSKKWIIASSVDVPPELQEAVGGHPLVAETLFRRGITTLDAAQRFLDPTHYTPASPFDLPDMDRAVERIERAISDGERVCVWGDFDVDGQTASALLVSALHELGADVNYYIPNRYTEGHGVHVGRLESLIDDGANVILTCDTGIAAHEAVDYCNERGVDVVITDHHQLAPTLPDAYAAVNPQRLDASHPLHTLPGVGCAFKLVEALYARRGWTERTTQFLDLVALGIVADVATQTGDTRYLLQRGLDVLRQTKRLGLQAMMQNADIVADQINAETIGFGFGPRMNALGRLGDANEAVELLTTDNPATAQILANRLEGLNHERRNQTTQIYEAALAQIEDDKSLVENYSVLMLNHESWSGGVVGIVASRLAEKFNRPVILLVSPPNEPAHGSARSVDGVDITAAIAQHSDLLDGFGGHTQAAGMSLPAENIRLFRRELSATVREMRGEQDAIAPLHIDATLPLGALSLDLVDDLARLAPFGAGNPSLVLATERVQVKSTRTLGRDGKHLRVVIADDHDDTREVVWWNADADSLPKTPFDLAYTASANTFKGERRLQLTWLDARLRNEPITDFSQRRDVTVIDHRDAPNPQDALENFLRECDERVVIWREGTPRQDVRGVARKDLTPAPVLVVWSAPPGLAVLQDALHRVNPHTIVLFGVDPLADSVNGFLSRFGGAVKHTLNAKHGQTTLDALSGALAHDPATIRMGLVWMQTRGKITFIENDGTLHLTADDSHADPDQKATTTAKLTQALQEAAHFRAYFRTADANSFLHK